MEYSGTWKEIWTQKGEWNGTKDDILVFDGWEKAKTDIRIIFEKIKNTVELKNDDKVIEVGCGAGAMAQFFDCDYVGIDFSEPLTKKCMEFFRLPAMCAEANDIPFKSNIFDKAISWGVFLYFPNIEYAEKTIEEMIRVTKKGGCVFIGDIPIESSNSRHMVYTKDFFEKRGFTIIEGWASPYEHIRFNAFYVKK